MDVEKDKIRAGQYEINHWTTQDTAIRDKMTME